MPDAFSLTSFTLAEKKEALRIRLQIRESCKMLENYWLPAYAYTSLKQSGASVSIKYMTLPVRLKKKSG